MSNINLKQRWNHNGDKTGRFRGGKTAADRAGGAAERAHQRKQAPIRRTSNYIGSEHAQKGPEFWGG